MIQARKIAALTVLTLVAAWGCVSSPVVAPAESQIIVGANPTVVVLDEFSVPPVTVASSVITAQLLSAEGVPLSGVSVNFSTDGGSLTSVPSGQAPLALTTDDNGFVSDTLTLQLGDPESAIVTVRSGILSQSIQVDKSEIPANQLPFPVIDRTPGGSAVVNEQVSYDGSFSTDPDGDMITCYRWKIETDENITNPELACVTNPSSRCEIEQGSGKSSLTRTYDQVQPTVRVELRVTDDPALMADCDLGVALPATGFSLAAIEAHDVVCDRTNPIADAGSNQVTSLAANPTGNVPLNGINSSDPEKLITAFEWDCGNATGTQSGALVTCTYTVVGTYIARLTVTNECFLTGFDTVTITVNP